MIESATQLPTGERKIEFTGETEWDFDGEIYGAGCGDCSWNYTGKNWIGQLASMADGLMKTLDILRS